MGVRGFLVMFIIKIPLQNRKKLNSIYKEEIYWCISETHPKNIIRKLFYNISHDNPAIFCKAKFSVF